MQMLLLYWSPWTCLYCFVGLKCEYEMLSSGEVSPIRTLPSCSPNFPYLLGEAPCFSHDNQNVVIWGECCHGIKQAHSNSDGKIKKKPLNRWSGAVLCCPSCSRGLWKGRAEHTHTHSLASGCVQCCYLGGRFHAVCCLTIAADLHLALITDLIFKTPCVSFRSLRYQTIINILLLMLSGNYLPYLVT